jgi:hypothetical protein
VTTRAPRRPLSWLADLWWLRLPAATRRKSESLFAIFVDGYYLVAWPAAAALAPVLLLLSGLVMGWQQAGFESAFSESMLLMMVIAIVGVLSANLGLYFTLGFALGHFLLWHDASVDEFARTKVPLLIEYGLIFLLAVGVPMATKSLLSQFTPPRVRGRMVLLGVAVAGHAAVTGVLVYLWAQCVPILIRPVFTWQHEQPPTEAISPLQTDDYQLTAVAVGASFVRMGLQGATTFRPAARARVDAWRQRLSRDADSRDVHFRGSSLAAAVAVSAVSTFMLAGMFSTWTEAVLLALLFLLIHAARARIVPVPLGRWPNVVYSLPMLFRLLVGTAVTIYLAQSMLPSEMEQTNSFRPLLVLLAIGLVVAFFLNPGLPANRPAERQ